MVALLAIVANVEVNGLAIAVPTELVTPEIVKVKVVFAARAADGVKVAVLVVAL
jgi:hypothetical protein